MIPRYSGIKKHKIRKMSSFLKHARHELYMFNKTRRYIYLEQAGEKIYNAYNYLLEILSRKEIRSHRDVDKIAIELQRQGKNGDILNLGKRATMLHVFFYEGKGTLFFYKSNIKDALYLFSRVRKKYNLY